MNQVTTNWSLLLGNESAVDVLKKFANGQLSKNATADVLAFSERAGEFRKLVRSRGTQSARSLARQALRRRGISV